MKYIRIGLVLLTLVMFFSALVHAQEAAKITIKAIVYDMDKKPVAGAVIDSEDDAENEVTSDDTGLFTISVPLNSQLSINAEGYKTKLITATAGVTEVMLVSLDDLQDVQVLFRKVQKKDLIGGVEAVDVKDLMKKNFFFGSLDNMEVLLPGFNGNSGWGMGSYLTLIDGIPRDANNVLPSEIDQIAFLKSASAVALYGSKAAKGVLSITTKKGEANNRQTVITVNSGVNAPKRLPKYLGAAEYMTLYNEARINDGLGRQPDFTDEAIYRTASGENPFRYPDIDYFSDQYLKNISNRHDVTAEFSGGNNRARFYTNVNYYTSGSFLDFGEGKKNDRTSRFSVRGNIDVDINQYIYSKVYASATFYDDKNVNGDFWGSSATLRPTRPGGGFSPLIPVSYLEEDDDASWTLIRNSVNLIDGKYMLGGSQLDQTNPFAAIYAGGWGQFISRQFQFNTSVGADLRNVLKGLTFQTDFAIDYRTSYNQAFNNTYATYQPLWNRYSGQDLISNLTKYGQDASNGLQNISNATYRQTLALASYFKYDNVLSGKHHITGLLVANGFKQQQAGEYHANGSANLGLQLGYVYDDKYLFDFSGNVIHSAKLAEGSRRAFSPTVSIGWRISEENFMKGASPVVDDLKIFANAGILNSDLDISAYYLYLDSYTPNGAWFGWDGGGYSGPTTESLRGANPNLSFPKREEISAGFEGTFFKRALKLQASAFTNRMTGYIVGGSALASVLYPSYFSQFVPNINYNADSRVGFDFAATFNKQIAEVNFTLGVTGTYYKVKAIKRLEVVQDEYKRTEGRIVDGLWGLESLGFFQSQEEIAASPTQFTALKPGDIKYKDQNGDGVINTRDEVLLGRAGWYGAPLTTGLHLTARWKKLTFFALGVGRYGVDAIKGGSYFWVGGEDKYSVMVRDRWTPATAATATYPRLTTQSKDNNFRTSNFWMYSANRFDLTKVQITYDLTSVMKHSGFVRELGVYVNGANLLTLSRERELMETNVGTAPQTRFYNLGIRALF